MPIINFIIYLLTMIGIYSLLAMSLNFQVGFTGLINFGQVAFFCIGAYTSSLLVVNAGVPILVGFLAAMALSGILGYIMSIPTKSLKSDYWAIATLASAEIVRLFALNEDWLTAGPFWGYGYSSNFKRFDFKRCLSGILPSFRYCLHHYRLYFLKYAN